ncbi:MAG: putative LPS assembly protein LptD [Bacteroidales bacterium]
MDMSFPKITFTVNRFYPFRKKVAVGKPKWYENVSVNYDMSAENRINTYDSLFFSEDLTNRFNNGMKHSVKLSSGSIKLLKQIVWSNNFNYTERWYSQKHVQSWRSDSLYFNEGPVNGFVGTDTVYGFNAVRDFNFSTSASTTLYGMFAYRNGPVKAIRHVMKPSLNFSLRPDFGTQAWGYYKYYINEKGEPQKYSMYDGFIYGDAPDGNSGSIGFQISNNLEMKIRARKDTITGTKKVVLIEDFTISTAYDLAKDSLNLSKLSLSGRTTLFKNLVINYSGVLNPYAADSLGRSINTFEWTVNKRLFRPESHSWRLGLSYQLSSDKLSKSKKESTKGTTRELEDVNENLDDFVDWTVPWRINISYNLNYTTNWQYSNGYWNYDINKEQEFVQTLSFNGDVNITPKWKVGIRSGYDFKNNDLTYTSIDVYRDLHCWEMRFNWIPFGFRQSWNFSINIKSSLLQDLKLDKKKDYRDF